MDSQASIKISINKLNPAFIKDIQEKYGDTELEITINQYPDFRPLKEATFWQLIDLLNWEKVEDVGIVEPLVQKLTTLPVGHIYNCHYNLEQQGRWDKYESARL